MSNIFLSLMKVHYFDRKYTIQIYQGTIPRYQIKNTTQKYHIKWKFLGMLENTI